MEKQNFQGHVCIVDDDNEMRSMLVDFMAREGFQTRDFASATQAHEFLSSSDPAAQNIEVVLTDLRMPEIDGIELLSRIRAIRPNLPVIVMTAFASVETAVEGLRKGAFDYITKPFKLGELSLVLLRAISFGRLKSQNFALTQEVRKTWNFHEIVGKSLAMRHIFDLIDRVAPANSSVLIMGESGTGKEVVAKTIHQNSSRKDKPFVAINCTAIPEALLEAELFGEAKGTFTGAIQRKKGLFEEAEGGTLFLDEIGDMDLSLQSKLLKTLQEKKIRPVGDNQARDVDVRVIAATHKDLKKSMLNGTFREDLYYRLSVIPIIVPPLRHRPEDIPLLAHHFLNKYAALSNGRIKGFSTEALQKLMVMRWEGNVRELESIIERMVVLGKSELLSGSDIPTGEQTPIEQFYGQAITDSPTLEHLEKRYIQHILEKTGGRKEKAAQILGINRRTLYRKEREYGFVDLSSEPPEEFRETTVAVHANSQDLHS